MGYGNKMDIARPLTCSPAPNTYSMKAEVDFMKDKHFGWTIGIGREVFALFRN